MNSRHLPERMRRVLASLCTFGVLITAVACADSNGSGAKPATNVSRAVDSRPAPTDPSAWEPTVPNPKLQTIDLHVGAVTLKTELALTMRQIQTGMMFRESIAEDEGMLFVFAAPHRAGFWMKNVDVPLSCAYIDPEGVILEIHDMEPHNEEPIEAQTARVQYVLEVAQGWFERHNIGPGTLIMTDRGTLKETFARR